MIMIGNFLRRANTKTCIKLSISWGIHSSRILLALDQTQWDLGWLHVMHCFLICEFIRANQVIMDMHMCRKYNQVEWSSGYHRMLHLKIFTSLMTNRLQVLPSWMGFWICASFLAPDLAICYQVTNFLHSLLPCIDGAEVELYRGVANDLVLGLWV